MSSHLSDELPGLLTGDANRDVVMAAAEHLRGCPDCQQDLVSAVVAHAALTSANRFAPEIVAADVDESDPDAQARTAGIEAPARQHAPDAAELPDLSSVFTHAHEAAAEAAQRPARRRHRALALAAAAVVLVGGGATIAAVELSGSSSSARSVALHAFATGDAPSHSAHAKVMMDGNKLRVDATTLPRLDSHHVYELWVTDSDRKNMSPVGTFSNSKAELTVARNVLAQYNDFEVSVQRTDAIKDYSGISVVRGQYG